MPAEAFLLRQATAADLPALAPVDASFSDEWVLHVERGGSAIEQEIARTRAISKRTRWIRRRRDSYRSR